MCQIICVSERGISDGSHRMAADLIRDNDHPPPENPLIPVMAAEPSSRVLQLN